MSKFCMLFYRAYSPSPGIRSKINFRSFFPSPGKAQFLSLYPVLLSPDSFFPLKFNIVAPYMQLQFFIEIYQGLLRTGPELVRTYDFFEFWGNDWQCLELLSYHGKDLSPVDCQYGLSKYGNKHMESCYSVLIELACSLTGG